VARSASTEQDQTEHNLINGGADAELASSGPATATVKLPFVQASLSLPPVRARFGGSDGDAGRAAGPVSVERLALYGGTAALGVLGVLEWPVVLAAAGGTYLLSSWRAGPALARVDTPHMTTMTMSMTRTAAMPPSVMVTTATICTTDTATPHTTTTGMSTEPNEGPYLIASRGSRQAPG